MMLRIPYTEPVNNKDVLRKNETKKKLVNQKELVEIPGMHSEESGLGEYDIDNTH